MTRTISTVPIRLVLLAAAVALLATGCLPAALEDGRPDAAVIGAPVNGAAPGAAAALDRALRERATGHDFVSASRMRFLEVRSGLIGSQVVPGAARLARSSSADLAVVVVPSERSRTILTPENRPTERLVLRLDVVFVRASDAHELGRLTGPRVVLERGLSDAALPAWDEDPLVASAVASSIADLAPRVADEMRSTAVSGSSAE